MKKTIDINIAGQLFRIDEESWKILKHYLDHVSARFRSEQGGEETLADIEARIAEIFGGGNEPPTLVSSEMVNNMINTMGAPEDYYDDKSPATRGTTYIRKSMYDPNSLSARTGRALSEFFTAFGKVMSAIMRVIAVVLGAVFTLFGFTMLFTFILLIFFNNAPFFNSLVQPEIINTHVLLSIVLSSNMVWPVLILAALVTLIPMAALIWLGIKMIFNIRERFRVISIIVFTVWIASLCALGLFLGLQMSVYSNCERVENKVSLAPVPKTLWIAPWHNLSEIDYDKSAAVDHFWFYMNSSTDRLYASANLNIYGSLSDSGRISVERRSCSKSITGAWANARALDYNWRLSGDTLYLDEYFSLPSGSMWNGSLVDIDISLPEGTEVRFVPGTSLSTWFRIYEPKADVWHIEDGHLRSLTKE